MFNGQSMHRRGRCLCVVSMFLVSICVVWPPLLAAKCKLGKLVEFPTTVTDLRPMVSAKVDGTDVRFIVDSGAFYSMISPASAAALKLRTFPAPIGLSVRGVGGSIRPSLARIGNFELDGTPLHDVEFIVGGNDMNGSSIGLLGRNILQLADAEFDLAHGVVRLMAPEDCGDALLAYWVHAGEPYSVVSIVVPREAYLLGSRTTKAAHFKDPIVGVAYVNGVGVRAMFDTGASTSFLTLKAAARAGIKLNSPGVTSAGYSSGIGRSQVANYLAPVSSFKIGDEEVRNTRLRLGDTDLDGETDMLIGADFFLSHHVYVANGQHKLYFTYNGGPVFNLRTVAASMEPLSAAASGTPVAEATPSLTEADAQGVMAANRDAPSAGDAGDHARRGAAFASRQEFDKALPALTRACELAPDNPDYFYQRGVVYWRSKQPKYALADFDRALDLKPNHLLALVGRGELRIQAGDKSGAKADFDAVSAAVPKEDAERFSLAAGYGELGLFASAIEQYNLWTDSHPQDVRLPTALAERCRARALGGVDLRSALDDCNKALKHSAKSSPLYAQVSNSRGLVLFRLGEYGKSIADYDASLKIEPRGAWSLYGRGIAEMRAKKISEGETDMAQAKVISPEIAKRFDEYGLFP